MVLVVENPSAYAGDIRDMGLIPGSRRPPRGGHRRTPGCLPGESHRQRSLAGSQRVGHD